MTHITIERAKLEQILEALESQHRDRLNYTLAKRSANATCAEFKVNTLSELIESGYMHGIGKQTESAITVAKQALEQPAPVPTNCRHCGGPDNVLCGGQCKAAAQPAPSHPDDLAVDRFAVAMKDKLAKAREKGRSGWETCPPDDLSRMLREHVGKGDPRDVANFAMMLWSLGAGIAATPPAAQPAVPDAITDIGENPDYRAGWNECRETMLQILKARTL
jgi:hypothetical protein